MDFITVFFPASTPLAEIYEWADKRFGWNAIGPNWTWHPNYWYVNNVQVIKGYLFGLTEF